MTCEWVCWWLVLSQSNVLNDVGQLGTEKTDEAPMCFACLQRPSGGRIVDLVLSSKTLRKTTYVYIYIYMYGCLVKTTKNTIKTIWLLGPSQVALGVDKSSSTLGIDPVRHVGRPSSRSVGVTVTVGADGSEGFERQQERELDHTGPPKKDKHVQGHCIKKCKM